MGIISKEKITGLCAFLFIVGIAGLFYIGYPDLWAGIMLVSGAAMVIRQLLLVRFVGLLIAVVVFGGAWAAQFYDFHPRVVVPLAATVGALYVLVVQLGYRNGNKTERRDE